MIETEMVTLTRHTAGFSHVCAGLYLFCYGVGRMRKQGKNIRTILYDKSGKRNGNGAGTVMEL